MRDKQRILRNALRASKGVFPHDATHFSYEVDWLFYKIVDGVNHFYRYNRGPAGVGPMWSFAHRQVALTPIPIDFILDHYEAPHD